jgi:hypothetical protein
VVTVIGHSILFVAGSFKEAGIIGHSILFVAGSFKEAGNMQFLKVLFIYTGSRIREITS